MSKYFVDSNVFLRFFTADDPKQQAAAQEVFLKAKAGEIELFCGPPVFFEIAWVLRSRYKVPQDQILSRLESILTIPNLHVLDGDYVRQALYLAQKTGQSYSDSYIAVTAKDKHMGVITFNKQHFSKLGAQLYQLEA